MLQGPDQIIACPSCGGLERFFTLDGWIRYHVYLWTDGFRVSEEPPDNPHVVKCRHCSHVYWLKDAEVIGEISNRRAESFPPEWQSAKPVVEASETDYYAALASGFARNPEEERGARVLAWWKSNEPLRGEAVAQVYAAWARVGPWNPDPRARQANMELLLNLLDLSDAGDRLIKAELLRELGRFDEALAALREVDSDHFSWVVDQIRPLCEQEDTLVKPIDFSNRPKRVPAPGSG
jgi:hypothetical protein